MDELPRWKLHLIDDTPCWCIDWRDHFRAGLKSYSPFLSGEMRRFHVVFRLRMHESGTFYFWDDDGSIIRSRGEVVHDDRSSHKLKGHTLEVETGQVIEVSQWQIGWDWLWCARLETHSAASPLKAQHYLVPYLPTVLGQLNHPTGPPLKMYTSGAAPIRAIASIYSMILNGYTPDGVVLFGDEQWPERTHRLFAEYLPFARVVPQSGALMSIEQYGGRALAQCARDCWFVMKAFIGLAVPPTASCMMDDDVLVLDRVEDALEAFSRCELVYIPDQDLTEGYNRTWAFHFGRHLPLRTARFNAGLYWIRDVPEAGRIVRAALDTPVRLTTPFDWEQGLIALAYADRPTHELPSQRYFYPLFDGLPGGMLGYDYRRNPCGFTTLHYGGLAEKPSEAATIQLLSDILDRKRNTIRENSATA